MSTDEDLAARVRAALSGAGAIREVKMFGGIGFMLNGNMVVAVSKRGLLVRVGKDEHSEALKRPGARPMEMRGRTMEGYVFVDPPMLNERAIKTWIQMASTFVRTLPPKGSAAKPKSKNGTRK
jgi:TfoX/Sxy family transcriptional regulator of competence genes